MIPGILVQGIQGGLASLALGGFDFLNGTYTWDGVSYSAADIIDRTDWIGANGLEVPASQSAGAQIILTAATDFLAACEFSCVAEIETLAGSEQVIFTIDNAGEAFFIEFEYFDGFAVLDNDGNTLRSAADGILQEVGTLRAAFSRTSTRLALSPGGMLPSVDNGTISSDSSSLPWPDFPMVNFYLGGFASATTGAVKIHSITFYSRILTDSQLSELSV